ncbi:hypothetical protein GOBAR_DD06225 [Gossypium barbadense]|nr:hypothetical protein GOBAR_DD06225 [Gossypium barbadense]
MKLRHGIDPRSCSHLKAHDVWFTKSNNFRKTPSLAVRRKIRRSLLNEDEYGFRKAKRLIYYDEGLEQTRQTLNKKISQLNSAIDNVSSRLRGGNNSPTVLAETELEFDRKGCYYMRVRELLRNAGDRSQPVICW